MTQLPPVTAAPLDDTERRVHLGGARLRFVESLVGPARLFHVRKTDTKVDAGHWLGRRRVWLCLLERELLLFARGRRPYVERIPLADLVASRYNHVTGELVLVLSDPAAPKALKIPPLPALEIQAQLSSVKSSV